MFLFADACGEQVCAVVKCVDLKDSYDVVFDEVLCVEKFEVDLLSSFACALSCRNALTCCAIGGASWV